MNDDDVCMPCEEPVIDKFPPCPLQCRSSKCKSYVKHCIDSKKTPVLWVVGGPGSGRTTQCEKIAGKIGYSHLNIGDLLRQEIKSGSNYAQCLATITERHAAVPNDIVLNVLKQAMLQIAPQSKGFLIDGYPREKAQGVMFEKNVAPCAALLYFDASPEALAKRALSSPSKHHPHNEATVNTRIQDFLKLNGEVIDHFSGKVQRINAAGTDDEIFKQVQKVMESVVNKSVSIKN